MHVWVSPDSGYPDFLKKNHFGLTLIFYDIAATLMLMKGYWIKSFVFRKRIIYYPKMLFNSMYDWSLSIVACQQNIKVFPTEPRSKAASSY